MTITNPIEELIALFKNLLKALDFSEVPSETSQLLHEMLENALQNDLVKEFLDSMETSGKTLEDILEVIIIDHSKLLLKGFVKAWVTLQRSVEELLEAVDAIQQEALDEVTETIMEMVGRKINSAEITEAKKIYGNTFDYDTIYLTVDSPLNDVTFAVQDYYNGHPNSRAFVTCKLIHQDADDGALPNEKLIHELCHVWQYQEFGPIYIIQAIHAQIPPQYNYGYTNSKNGNGAETVLEEVITDNPDKTVAEVFELFNREQQAQIIKHYYYRRYKVTTPLDYAPWQPFQDLVYTP